MSEVSNSPLRVESLKVRHLYRLAAIRPTERIGWLQLMVIKNLIAQLEKNLYGFLPSRNPFCYLALEYKIPISLLIATPCNSRGSCWSLDFPKLLIKPKACSESFVKQNLLNSALESSNNTSQSWLIRSQVSDTERLGLAREFGFQPLKLFNCWLPPSSTQDLQDKDTISSEFVDSVWQELNKGNVNDMLKLEHSSESGHLRQIFDRQCKDLLYIKSNYSRVLMTKNNGKDIAIAGLITRYWKQHQLTMELLRDLAWDIRVTGAFKSILNNFVSSRINISLETSQEDEYLTELLKTLGWKLDREILLLGRTMWRRQEARKLISGAKKLESMIGGLNPQTPSLPSPAVGIDKSND